MKRLLAHIGRLAADRTAAVSVEYVILLLPLLALVFTSFQIALAYHFALTAQKAVEQGARIAVVRDAVHNGLPATNAFTDNSKIGKACADPAETTAPCVDPGGPWVCDGGSLGGTDCDETAFNQIYNEIARIAYLLEPEQVTITYSYVNLGFAGGPFTPLVEVEIQERPFFLQFFFNLAFAGDGEGPEALQLPGVAASGIAEDLSSTN